MGERLWRAAHTRSLWRGRGEKLALKRLINKSQKILNEEGFFSLLIKVIMTLVYIIKEFRYISRIFWIDFNNKIHYGSSAPKYAERIWIYPRNIKMVITSPVLNGRRDSGEVIKDNWPLEHAIPLSKFPKIKFSIDHWTNNISWEETGLFDFMYELIDKIPGADGCYDKKDIICRYEKLDEIFKQIKEEGRLRTMEEIYPNNFREFGGVLIHVGPYGEPFFGGGGCHRFAIAYILNLPIPAQIGCVHVSALPYLDALRCEKECMNDRSDINYSHVSS